VSNVYIRPRLPQNYFLFITSRKLQIPLKQMAKQHTTTLRSEAHSVGKLANVICNDDWDAKYFVDNSTKMLFGKLSMACMA